MELDDLPVGKRLKRRLKRGAQEPSSTTQVQHKKNKEKERSPDDDGSGDVTIDEGAVNVIAKTCSYHS